MKRLAVVVCCAVSLTSTSSAVGQAPSLAHTSPQAVAPGATTELRLFGKNLAGATGLWTSFAATSELATDQATTAGDAGEVTYQMTIADDVSVGIGAVRVATGRGVSSLRLLLIDDLTSVAKSGGNQQMSTAQALTLPVAVDGHCEGQQFDYYKITAFAGQRLSAEVVARRLGFPLDPVLRLLDSEGRELAYSDDEPGIGVDSRFVHEFAAAGEYFLEIRDIRYQGGGQYRYRLRLGDFPLATVPFPMGIRQGETAQLSLAGPAVDGVPPIDVTAPADGAGPFPVAGKFPDGQGSGFVTVVTGDLSEKIEYEPNDTDDVATPLELPGAINGRFHAAGDRDYYQFTAQAGQRLVFTGRTRELGSPSDLFMRLFRADGTKIAEAEDNDKREGAFDHTFDNAGVYRLMVEDLHRRGGPEHAYRVEARPFERGFALSAEVEKLDVPRGGVFTAKVTAARRDYNGPIVLDIRGLAGLQLAGQTIPEGKSETVLRATVPDRYQPGTFSSIQIVGTVTIDGGTVSATAGTHDALRGLLAGLPFPPAGLDGQIAVGVGPVFPDFFQLAGPTHAVAYPRLVGNTTFTVRAERLNKFDGPIRLAIDSLPAGFSAEVEPIKKGQSEAQVKLTGPALLGGDSHALRVVGSAEFQNQPRRVELSNVELRAVDPIEVALVSAAPLTVGKTHTLQVQLTRHGGPPSVVKLTLKNLPSGVTVPDDLEIAADGQQLDIPLQVDADATPGEFGDVTVVASTGVNEQAVVVASRPVTLSLEPDKP